MIVSAPDMSRSRDRFGLRGPMPAVWGLNVPELHDRFWASRGVRVVRRGGHDAPLGGPGPFLLLEPEDLVIFDLYEAARKLPRRRRSLLRAVIIESDIPSYAEQVIAGESDRLVALQRFYAPQPQSELSVSITNSSELASLWRQSADCRSGQQNLRLAIGLHEHRETSCPGQVFDAADPQQGRRCLAALMSRWDNVQAACSDVRSIRPGVWVHRTARIAPDVRFVPPVWIGAGVALRRGDVVIGPSIINDEVKVAPANPPAGRPARCRSADRSARSRNVSRLDCVETRLFDIIFSLAILALLGPVFPLIMLAIWLEDGRPFFFKHVRQTVGGREFVCYKFRTMCKDADRLKADLSDSNVCDGPQFHIDDDPRLLRIGKVLRRFHLDELPQFFNVLLGQMNVIGPRPSPENENQFCPAWRETRLSVRPGLTGLWQVNRTRAPDTDFQEWIRFDLDYVHRRSWWLDLWIIYETTKGILLPKRNKNTGPFTPGDRQQHLNGAGGDEDAGLPQIITTPPPSPAASAEFNLASEVCRPKGERTKTAA